MKRDLFKVTGMNYHMDSIEELRVNNEDYNLTKKELLDEIGESERVYQYDYDIVKTELVPEPDNEHDKNAVAVVIDGNKVGYIKKGSASNVKNLIASPDFDHIETEIGGGPYKIVTEDDGEYTVEKGEAPVWIHVTVCTREDHDNKVKAIEAAQAEHEKRVMDSNIPPTFEAADTKKGNGGKFYKVCGIILIILGLILMLALPIAGIIFAFIGVFSLASARKKK